MLVWLALLLQDVELPKARDYVQSMMGEAIYAYEEPQRIGDLAERWLPGMAIFQSNGRLKAPLPNRCATASIFLGVEIKTGRVFLIQSVIGLAERMAKARSEEEVSSAALFVAKLFSCEASACEKAYGSLSPTGFKAVATPEGWSVRGKLRDVLRRDVDFTVRFGADGKLQEYEHTYKLHRH